MKEIEMTTTAEQKKPTVNISKTWWAKLEQIVQADLLELAHEGRFEDAEELGRAYVTLGNLHPQHVHTDAEAEAENGDADV